MLFFGALPSSDQDVESALNLAWSTIPAASAVPFLTIPALVELTPITEDKLKKYAARHVSGTSSEERQRRGVGRAHAQRGAGMRRVRGWGP